METIWTIFKVLLAFAAIYQFGKACDEENKKQRNGYD